MANEIIKKIRESRVNRKFGIFRELGEGWKRTAPNARRKKTLNSGLMLSILRNDQRQKQQ